MRFGLCGPTYSVQSPNVDCQRCINYYPENAEAPNSKAPIALLYTPGMKVFCTPTSEPKVAIQSTEVSQLGDKVSQIKTIEIRGGTPGTPTTSKKASDTQAQSAGDVAWTNPAKVEALDSDPATVALAVGQYSRYLDCKNLGFAIPANSTIQGIKASVTRKYTQVATAPIAPRNTPSSKLGNTELVKKISPTVFSLRGLAYIFEYYHDDYDVYSPWTSDPALKNDHTKWCSVSTDGTVTIEYLDNTTVYVADNAAIADAVVQLIKTGGYGDNKAQLYEEYVGDVKQDTPGDQWTLRTDYSKAVYGSATDTWNTGFTVADINDAEFGLRFQIVNGALGTVEGSGLVDYVEIEVFYTPPLPDKLVVETESAHGLLVGETVRFIGVGTFTSIEGWEKAITAVPDSTHFHILSPTNPWPAALYGPTADAGTVNDVIDSYCRIICEVDHHLGSGAEVTFVDMTLADWLNGATHIITSVPNSKTFKIATDHADYSTSEEGGSVIVGNVSAVPRARGEYCLPDKSRAFVISGAKLYEIFADKTYAERGTVNDDSKPVSFTSSATELLISSAGKLYKMGLADNSFDGVPHYYGGTDDIPDVASVHYLSGYFIAVLANSQKFIFSNLLYATRFSAADIIQVSLFPDNIVSAIVDHLELVLKGSTKSICYQFTGSDQTFEPVLSSIADQGSAAAMAISRFDNSHAWIGSDDRGTAMAWRENGYIPQRISNFSVETAWAEYSTIADAVSYSYQDHGHTFWVVYFPTANATWVYDAATNMWHERQFGDGTTNTITAHRSQNHMFFAGKHIVGDWATGNLFEMSLAYFDDFGNPILRDRRAPHVFSEGKRIPQSRLQLDVETGLGTLDRLGYGDVGYGEATFGEYGYGTYGYGVGPLALELLPKMKLWRSRDSGRTWEDMGEKDLGAPGEYTKRVYWNRLGSPRDVVYRITTSDSIPIRIADAYLNP